MIYCNYFLKDWALLSKWQIKVFLRPSVNSKIDVGISVIEELKCMLKTIKFMRAMSKL